MSVLFAIQFISDYFSQERHMKKMNNFICINGKEDMNTLTEVESNQRKQSVDFRPGGDFNGGGEERTFMTS